MADVHVSPVSLYASILVTLLVLTGLTVWVAAFDLGWANDAVALGVAITKASLVVLFFMHVKYAGKLVQVVVGASFFWLLILFGLTVIDYATRNQVVADPIAVTRSVESAPRTAAPGTGATEEHAPDEH